MGSTAIVQNEERSSDPSSFDFEEMYRTHIAYLWRTLQRLGIPKADLEDRAHDVFSVVYRKKNSFDASLAFRPWLFGIAFRVASDARKRARVRQNTVTSQTEHADDSQPQDEALRKREMVLRGLSGLSMEQRAVIIMHDLDGYTAPEISEHLKIELNTVYSRLRLGRARFVAALKQQHGEKA